MANAQSAPAAPVSTSGSAPAPGRAQGVTPIPVKFILGNKPMGTPGEGNFQLKETLGLGSPVYSSMLLNVWDVCVSARLNTRATISKQNDDDDNAMDVDGPVLHPDLTRGGKNTNIAKTCGLVQAGSTGSTVTESGVDPIAASTPAPPKRTRPPVRSPPSMDVPAANPTPGLVTFLAGSAPPSPTINSATAPGSPVAPAPKSGAG
ncbi:hypothetical protein FRC12_006288 [Ceratobasidium sp. 428]|nr:hypothetical protein FRC12_006288 [Ceratobasidium sp. 428]